MSCVEVDEAFWVDACFETGSVLGAWCMDDDLSDCVSAFWIWALSRLMVDGTRVIR